MAKISKAFYVEPRNFVRAGEASLQIQRLLKNIGFDNDLVRRVAVCAYEAEMNIVMYGGEGEIQVEAETDLIRIVIQDDGEGIEDIEKAMQEGFSTAPPEYREMGFGAGMGLPNIKKNSDSFEIFSKKGEGTHIELSFRVN